MYVTSYHLDLALIDNGMRYEAAMRDLCKICYLSRFLNSIEASFLQGALDLSIRLHFES